MEPEVLERVLLAVSQPNAFDQYIKYLLSQDPPELANDQESDTIEEVILTI